MTLGILGSGPTPVETWVSDGQPHERMAVALERNREESYDRASRKLCQWRDGERVPRMRKVQRQRQGRFELGEDFLPCSPSPRIQPSEKPQAE